MKKTSEIENDTQPDKFESRSKPLSDYLQFPAGIELNWIATEEDIFKLESLLTETFIGIDSEWKINLHQ